MTDTRSLILNENQVSKKLDRMVYEVRENFFGSDRLFVVGIARRGFTLAKEIAARFDKKDPDVELLECTVNPKSGEVDLSMDIPKGASVLLVDDVLNTGKTLMAAAASLFNFLPKDLKTLVLVDRRHRQFPVRADIVGMTLSTTLKEHIEVEFKAGKAKVYLK